MTDGIMRIIYVKVYRILTVVKEMLCFEDNSMLALVAILFSGAERFVQF